MILMDTQAVKPTYQDAFMVAFGEPEGESVKDEERQKKTIISVFSTTILRNYAKDEIRTLLQHGHRRKNILIRLLVKWALRKPPPVVADYILHEDVINMVKRFILSCWGDYSFSLYFCWFNLTPEERWEAKPDYNLTFDGYERDSISYKNTDFDRKKAIKIMDKILDIMEPLVDKQLPKTRLNCWMNADAIKIEITNE